MLLTLEAAARVVFDALPNVLLVTLVHHSDEKKNTLALSHFTSFTQKLFQKPGAAKYVSRTEFNSVKVRCH